MSTSQKGVLFVQLMRVWISGMSTQILWCPSRELELARTEMLRPVGGNSDSRLLPRLTI